MYLLELDVHGRLFNKFVFITPKMTVQLDISNGVITSIGLIGVKAPTEKDLELRDYVNDKLAILKNNYQQALASYFRREIITNFLKKNIGVKLTHAQFIQLLKDICDDYLSFVDQILHQFSIGHGDWVLTAIQAQDYGYDYVLNTNLNFLVHQELGLKTNVYLEPAVTKLDKVVVSGSLYNSSTGDIYYSDYSECSIYGSTTYTIARNQNPPK